MKVTNRLREIRTRSRLSAAALAERAGVSRQTIHAIESGAYAPNTALALQLARLLEVGVEDLFRLADDAPAAKAGRAALTAERTYPGAPLRLARVGRRVVAAPWSPEAFALPAFEATTVAQTHPGQVDIRWRAGARLADSRLALAGCDPAVSLLAAQVENACGVELLAVPSASAKALRMLRDGLVHMAGTHLGKRRARTPRGCRSFVFAEWEEGLVTASGNPKRLRAPADLANGGARIVNRERGSGSRALLDDGLEQAGVKPSAVAGYDDTAPGHLAAAWRVRQGKADCCIAPRIAADVFGLGFAPLAAKRYDLTVSGDFFDLPAVQALLDVLNRASFRRELAALGGYDTRRTGAEAVPAQ